MTNIRVNPPLLREASTDLIHASAEANRVGGDVRNAVNHAPSYDGQFGPKLQAIGAEAIVRAQSLANSIAQRSQELLSKADAFEAVDHAAAANLNSLWLTTQPRLMLPPWFKLPEIPDWLWELLIGFLPLGDLYDIGKELLRLIREGEVDELVLALSALGLIADLGWADGPIPDPLDGANGGLALLKALVKQIPPGPARDGIADVIKHLTKNADEAPRFFNALFQVVRNEEVFTALTVNHRALAALLEAGPDVMEQLAKHEDVALAIIQHEDVAIRLLTNNQALDAILRGGPDAAEQLLKHGDDIATRYLDEIATTDLANIELVQGLDVSKIAQDYDVDIHIAGRLADSPVEVELRRLAAEKVDELVDEGVPRLEAQLQVADEFGIDFYQARVSSGKPEVDAFIPKDQWESLSMDQQEAIRQHLADIFGVDADEGVDLYQELQPLIPEDVGLPPGQYSPPDPKTNVPPGSIHFDPSGTIEHPPLGNPEILLEVFRKLGIPWLE